MIYIGFIELLINLILIFLSCVILILILEKVKPNPYVKQPHLIKVIWKIGISIGYGLSSLVILVIITSLFIPFGWGFITLFINILIFWFLLSSFLDIRKATVINNFNQRVIQVKKKKK